MWLRRSNRSNLSDEALIRQYQKTEDMEVLGVVYERYLAYTYGICLKYFKEPQVSQDAVMAIFELLVKKVKTHTIDHFKGWLYVVAKNYCLGQIRKKKNARMVELNGEFMHSEELSHHDEEFDFVGQYHDLQHCLEKLPDIQKKTVEKFYMDGKSYQEIAEDLTVTKDMVRSYIQNGRRNLRICMEKGHGKEA